MNLINNILTYSNLTFKVMKKEPFIFHSPLLEGLPRITIVGQISDNKLLIGASRCSTEDHFVKKTGVTLAKSRIEKGEFITVIQLDDNSQVSYSEFIGIAVTVMDSVLAQGLKPIILIPTIQWEWMKKEDFDELELEFSPDDNLDEEGFVIYENKN